MEELTSCFFNIEHQLSKVVLTIKHLSSPPRLSNGVAKVWGTGYLLIVMGGPRRGKKRWHFSPESKIAHEKSTFLSSSGFFQVKKRPEASYFFPILCQCFSCVFPGFHDKNIQKSSKVRYFCSSFSLCHMLQKAVQVTMLPQKQLQEREASLTEYSVPDQKFWAWKKMAWKFPTIILDMKNVTMSMSGFFFSSAILKDISGCLDGNCWSH